MAKVKKSPKQNLIGQIDRLLNKNRTANSVCQRMMIENSKISQSVEHREIYMEIADTIERISKKIQRRSQALKKKKEKLAEIQTMDLPV